MVEYEMRPALLLTLSFGITVGAATAFGQNERTEEMELPLTGVSQTTALNFAGVPPNEPIIKRIAIGQTPEEVNAVLGEPSNCSRPKKHKRSIEFKCTYMLPDLRETTKVTFIDGKMAIGEATSWGGPSTLETVLNAASSVYLALECPKLRNKPVLLLTTNDLQTLQMCTAAGL